MRVMGELDDELLDGGLVLFLLNLASGCNVLQALRPEALRFVEQWLLQRGIQLGNVSQGQGIVLAGEAVIEQIGSEPGVQISNKAISDWVWPCPALQ
jgi:hypothetical protein